MEIRPWSGSGARPGHKARVNFPGRTGTGALGSNRWNDGIDIRNSRCNEGLDIRVHHRVDRGDRDDKRGVQRDSQNLHREHARARQTTGHDTGRENYNRCLHRRERARE